MFLFTSLPFGISTALWLFTKVMGVMKDLFHKDGLSLFQYMDNLVENSLSKQEVQTSSPGQTVFPSALHDQFPKVSIQPHICLRLCGHSFQPVPRESLRHSKEPEKGYVSSRADESSGSDSGSKMAIPYWHSPGTGHPHSPRETQSEANPIPPVQILESEHRPSKPVGSLSSDNQVHSAVVASSGEYQSRHSPRASPFRNLLFVDASKKGLGAYLEGITCQGTCSQPETSPLSLQHPSYVSCSCRLRQYQCCCIHQQSWGGARSWSIWKGTESMFLLVTTLNISIFARFIPGRMNVIADELSRAD